MTQTETVFFTVGIILAVLLLLFALFLFLIAPGLSRKRSMEKYKGIYYAHRGLHTEGIAENSLSAFSAAADAGFGVELDVRLSADGVLVVFHDDTLERMTVESGRVDARTADELSKIRLADTEDTIPTFAEVLKAVNGRVPILVEIKDDTVGGSVAAKTAELLREYSGDYIVESFNPVALGDFKRRCPQVLCGVLSESFMKEAKYRKPLYFMLQCLLLNVVCRPDFIAFNHRDHKNAALNLTRGIFRVPTLAWTVRSSDEEAAALEHGFDGVIFEGYIPNKTTKR